MAIHSSILVWRIHRQRSLAGHSAWGHKESDTTEGHTHTHWFPVCWAIPPFHILHEITVHRLETDPKVYLSYLVVCFIPPSPSNAFPVIQAIWISFRQEGYTWKSLSEEDIAVEGPSYHMEMKYHVQEKGPRLVSLGEMHLWQDQLGKNQ